MTPTNCVKEFLLSAIMENFKENEFWQGVVTYIPLSTTKGVSAKNINAHVNIQPSLACIDG